MIIVFIVMFNLEFSDVLNILIISQHHIHDTLSGMRLTRERRNIARQLGSTVQDTHVNCFTIVYEELAKSVAPVIH